MGLSASQARLLSITARLSDNELHSQQIANAKIRLADQSQAASREYVNALDTQKLVYTMYDAKGNSTKVNLTPAVMYDYSEIKNQYGISNTSGQLLISAQDANNYKNSSNLVEFLGKYGISLQKNTAYDETIAAIYEENAGLFNINNKNAYIEGNNYYETYLANLLPHYETNEMGVQEWVNNLGTQQFGTLEEYNAYRTNFLNALDQVSAFNMLTGDEIGYFAAYVDALRSIPEFTEEEPPRQIDYTGRAPQPIDAGVEVTLQDYPDLYQYAQDLICPQCWNDTGISVLQDPTKTIRDDLGTLNYADTLPRRIWHIEHVLAQYVWPNSGASSYSIGDGREVNKTSSSRYGLTAGGGDGSDPMNVRGVLENNPDLKLRLQELYYDVLVYVDRNNDTTPNDTSNPSKLNLPNGYIMCPTDYTVNEVEIGNRFASFIKDLLKAVAKDIIATDKGIDIETTLVGDEVDLSRGEEGTRWYTAYEGLSQYITAVQQVNTNNKNAMNDQDALNMAEFKAQEAEYQRKCAEYMDMCQEYKDKKDLFLRKTISEWLINVNSELSNYRRFLDNVPEEYIIDRTDPKTQWYINLWHRINGPSETKSTTIADDPNGTSGKYWKILDDSLYKSSSWLQYALEQGLVTIEQVQREDDVETETGLTNTKWKTREYTTCVDINLVDDETAVARAEAIYTRKLNEIEAQDKKLDNDIKKLDTEHNALQAEYESLKDVVSKNVERSFKAFS